MDSDPAARACSILSRNLRPRSSGALEFPEATCHCTGTCGRANWTSGAGLGPGAPPPGRRGRRPRAPAFLIPLLSGHEPAASQLGGSSLYARVTVAALPESVQWRVCQSARVCGESPQCGQPAAPRLKPESPKFRFPVACQWAGAWPLMAPALWPSIEPGPRLPAAQGWASLRATDSEGTQALNFTAGPTALASPLRANVNPSRSGGTWRDGAPAIS
jgi:hypothetical protein